MAPPHPSDLAAPFLWAQELLDCACEALTLHAPEGCPERACVYNGGVEVAFDDCCAGQLWVAWGRTYSTEVFPEQRPENTSSRKCFSQGHMLAIDFEIGIVRCAPTIDDYGTPPSCEQIEASALQMHQEAYIILRAVTCCLAEWVTQGHDAVWTEQIPAGDEGTCVGSVLKVTVGLNCLRCIPDPEPEG